MDGVEVGVGEWGGGLVSWFGAGAGEGNGVGRGGEVEGVEVE